MSPVPQSAPRRWSAGVIVLTAGLLLAACGTVTPPPFSGVVGIPSISLTVPLQVVACTTGDSCVALGASGSDFAPTSTGEVRSATSTWRSLNVPGAPSSQLTSSSCWDSGCLAGGIGPGGDLVWRYLVAPPSVTVVSAPRGGRGVESLTCYAPGSCALVDTTSIVGDARLSLTSDGGVTWSPAEVLPWSAGDVISSVTCRNAQQCLVTATDARGGAAVESTTDGGVTWRAGVVGPWSSLSSLTCQLGLCRALATSPQGSLAVTSTNFGETWTSTVLPAHANALACSPLGHCVLVGQPNPQAPWIARWRGTKFVSPASKYVPSPLVGVACGDTLCAAIGASTLAVLRP